jgi:glycosyltransferase involved in cell wall biosynthesis
MGYLNLALLAMRPMLKSKLIIREANTVAATEAMLPRWLPARWSYRILYPRANAVVAPTDEIKEQIATFVSKAAAPLVIANPVDEQTLRQRATPPARPAGRGLVIVGAGRLTTQKGFDRLLEIVPLLPADARLFIFGDGGDRPFLNERVRSLGLADRVSFAGFNASLPASIAGADVFVLPSRWEGLSNVSLEALAVGTPVIAAEEAGLQEVARAAPAGAVTIAAVGPDFATAISRIQPNNAGQSVPRPSLLPAKYRTANAAAEFANLLLRVAA